jgi:hypothetical protein
MLGEFQYRVFSFICLFNPLAPIHLQIEFTLASCTCIRDGLDFIRVERYSHTLPMFKELQFEDICFGSFLKVGAEMDASGFWPNNSFI